MAVVREIQGELDAMWEDERWPTFEVVREQERMLGGLKVVEVHVAFEILDDDGRERVRVSGSAS